jgi:uncharacterized protein Smg (DUF494 family)
MSIIYAQLQEQRSLVLVRVAVKLQRERLQVAVVKEHVLVTLFAQVSKVVSYLS